MSSYTTTSATPTPATPTTTSAHIVVRLVIVVVLLVRLVSDAEQLVVETVAVATTTLVQQYVQSVFEDASLGEFDFGVFTICGVHDGRATYFGNLCRMVEK